MKNKNKLTPEVYKQITSICENLPAFHRKDKNGKLMYRITSRFVKGSELSKETKLQSSKEINPTANYVQRGTEAILVNHKVTLIEVYQKDGQPGIDTYVKFFKDITETKNEDNAITPITK